MALPTSVTVTGEYFKSAPGGAEPVPETGSVIFVFRERLVNPVDDDIAGPFHYVAPLVDGKFTISLPATNDPSWSPTNGTYLVKEDLSASVNVRSVVIPYDAPGGALDMADIPDATVSPQPDVYVFQRMIGQPDGIAPLGSDGLIPDSFIPASSGGSGIPDATPTTKGGIVLAGDLAGTASAPTVPALADKASLVHTHPMGEVSGLSSALANKADVGHTHDGVGSVAWIDITDKPAVFPPAEHDHAIAEVEGLQEVLETIPSGEYAPLVHTHSVIDVTGLQAILDAKAESDHTHTVTGVTGLQEILDGKQAAGDYAEATHTHAIADTTGLQAALDGKQPAGSYAAASHTHAIADTTGLQAALDGKQPAGSYATAGHTHTSGQVTDFAEAVDDRVAALLVAGTNITLNYNDETNQLTVSSAAGSAGVTSVNTRTGAVTLTSSDVGLGNVNNTSDANKPVSTAQQTALDAKLTRNRTLATDSAADKLRTNLTYAVTINSSDYEQVSVNGTVVCWRNEVGFLRGTPHAGYKDDALVRGVPRGDLTNENGGFIELENSARNQVLYKRSWRTGALWRGNGSAAAVQMADVLVLATGVAVPAGTPSGTVIVRTA